MNYQDHILGVGAVVMNLQALETGLRRFLVDHFGQCSKFPTLGDKVACRSYLTADISLGPLIDDYHKMLTDKEDDFKVDRGVVEIRDALAHGRLLVRGEEWPAILWKFARRPVDGKIPIEYSEPLSQEWFKAKIPFIDAQFQKVIACSKARGYKGLS